MEWILWLQKKIVSKNVLHKIKQNITLFNYGSNMLDITGPCTVGSVFNSMYHSVKQKNSLTQYVSYDNIFKLKSTIKKYMVLRIIKGFMY